MANRKSKYEKQISKLVKANEKKAKAKAKKGGYNYAHYYHFLAELQKLCHKKEAEYKVGRYFHLHTFITRDWEIVSDQWRARTLETFMQGGETFNDVVALTNCHDYFSPQRLAEDKASWEKQLEGYKELVEEHKEFWVEHLKEQKLSFMNNSGGKKLKFLIDGKGTPKYSPTYTTLGLGKVYRRMHPKTAPNVRDEMIKDYFKMQKEQGLPFASEHPKNKHKLNQDGLRKMFEAQGMEYMFHIYGALASVEYMKDLVEEIRYLERRKTETGSEEYELSQWRTPFGRFYADTKDKDILHEKIIFQSAIQRLRTVKGITEETLYTFVLYLYQVFADDEGWVKSREHNGQTNNQYWFAEELMYRPPVAGWNHYHTPMSEFLNNVEEFEELKFKNNWRTIEDLYRDKYFPNSKLD